jgi:hypothetical protein
VKYEDLLVELARLELATPCLQSTSKMSSAVCGLARSAPRAQLSTVTSRPVGVGCGCHRDPVKSAETNPRRCPVTEPSARAPDLPIAATHPSRHRLVSFGRLQRARAVGTHQTAL